MKRQADKSVGSTHGIDYFDTEAVAQIVRCQYLCGGPGINAKYHVHGRQAKEDQQRCNSRQCCVEGCVDQATVQRILHAEALRHGEPVWSLQVR